MTLPNGPQTPALIQMLQWIADPIGYLEIANQCYGDIFTAKVGWNFGNHVFVSNPKGIQQIFTNESKQFAACNDVLNKFAKPIMGEHSVFTADPIRHRRKRQFLMPHFHGDRLELYGATIHNFTEKVLSQLTFGQPFYARQTMLDISLKVIFEIVFGLYESERCQRLKYLLALWMDTTASPLDASMLFLPFLQQDLGPQSPWGKFLQLKKEIGELLYIEMQERRQNYDPSRTDIMTMLLSARDEAGEAMTNEELHDELLSLLVAGHETTATAIAWALYWIHHVPQVREKLLSELVSQGEEFNPMAIARLPYLSAICSETVRIYPLAIVNMPHIVQEPVELMGYKLPPGTIVVANIYQTHQRPDIYPEPYQFKPERFLEREFSPYEYLPFGGGSRRCLGSALAPFEMKLVLATILRRYQLALYDNKPVRAERRSTTLSPVGGVKMMLIGERQRQPAQKAALVG